MNKKSLNIGIWLRGEGNASQWMGGVYYIHNLVRALSLIKKENPIVLKLLVSPNLSTQLYEEIKPFIDEIIFLERSLYMSKERLVWILKSILNMNMNPLFLGYLRPGSVDVIFPVLGSLGKWFPIPWIGWIPDFQHYHLPEFFGKKEVRRRNKIFSKLAKDAPLLVLSSEDARKDFNILFPDDNVKVHILHFRSILPEKDLILDPSEILEKYNLPNEYLCLSNQFFVHKNHILVFKSLSQLKQKGVKIPLVCTGHLDKHHSHFKYLTEFIKKSDLEGQIKILGLIPRSDQIQIMKRAAAIIQPSLFEGWSTVVEDARTLGKLVFLSDIPVHREQNPPNSIYFDPLQPEGLADLLFKWWKELEGKMANGSDKNLRRENEKYALNYARRFLKIVEEIL